MELIMHILMRVHVIDVFCVFQLGGAFNPHFTNRKLFNWIKYNHKKSGMIDAIAYVLVWVCQLCVCTYECDACTQARLVKISNWLKILKALFIEKATSLWYRQNCLRKIGYIEICRLCKLIKFYSFRLSFLFAQIQAEFRDKSFFYRKLSESVLSESVECPSIISICLHATGSMLSNFIKLRSIQTQSRSYCR